MAKDDKGKVRITVIHFETESSNETLQENIRAIANTISRSLMPQPARVVVAALPQLPAGDSDESILDTEDDYVDADPAVSTPAKPKRPRKSRVTPASIINDLDLESGDVSLKAFYDAKNPPTQTKKYLVVAAWLKEYRGIDEITGDHIYTCFRWLKMKTPPDIAQPLRDLKKLDWIDSGSTKGTYSINRIGLNEVNDMGKGD